MKTKLIAWLVVVGIIVFASAIWILHFHTGWIAPHFANHPVAQRFFVWVGEKQPEAAPDDDEPDTQKNEVPVHTAQISKATFHRYIDAFGIIAPRPPRNGSMAGGTSIAAPVPGVVAEVLCQTGQQVKKGAPLIQLDDRLAKSAEQQSAAALAQEKAVLANLKATPRPEQVQIAQLAVDKSRSAVDFAQKNYDRLKPLATGGGTPSHTIDQAAQDLASAQNDLAVSEKQLALLKESPTQQELDAENAKVVQAEAALAAAKTQRELLRIVAPIDGTVVSVNANPGEPVDISRTLVQLIAMDRLMVDVDVPSEQLSSLSEGQSVLVVPSGSDFGADASSPDAGYQGKVSFISPQIDPKTGTVQVGIDLAPGPLIRPGLAVRARIIVEEHKDRLAVPREAVVTDENNDSVISVVEGDQATHKSVKAGFQENGLIEIDADGLKEGDTVVTAGAYGLPAASRVKVIP